MVSTQTHNSCDACDVRLSLQRWLLGLLLCCGGAIVWAVLLGWIGSRMDWWLNRGQMIESRSVQLRDNGEPYVIVNRYSRDGREGSRVYQSVDGKPITFAPDELMRTEKTWQASLFANSYMNSRHAPNEINLWIDAPEPFPWSLSLLQFVDADQYPGTGGQWYFRWPRRAGGSGFFEGFDLKTKRRLGFIGLNGFSETEPLAADQFPAWDTNKSATATFITQWNNGQFPPNSAALAINESGESPEYGVWFITPKRDRIFVINLTRRSVAATRVLSGKLLGTSHQRDVTGRSELEMHALLWEERLEIVSPTLETLREIRFPPELKGKINTISELPSGEFEMSHWSTSPRHGVINGDQQFIRFNDRGEVTLRQTITVLPATTSRYWSAEQFVTPLSLMPISVASWLAPYRSGYMFDQDGKLLRQPDEPLTWSVQLRAFQIGMRSLGWNTSFWLTLLSGLPFAVLCVWRQRTLPVSRFDRVAWPLLLCVFGIAGWVAFLSHRRWPTRRVAIAVKVASQMSAA